jgi:hypothetical protein
MRGKSTLKLAASVLRTVLFILTCCIWAGYLHQHLPLSFIDQSTVRLGSDFFALIYAIRFSLATSHTLPVSLQYRVCLLSHCSVLTPTFHPLLRTFLPVPCKDDSSEYIVCPWFVLTKTHRLTTNSAYQSPCTVCWS